MSTAPVCGWLNKKAEKFGRSKKRWFVLDSRQQVKSAANRLQDQVQPIQTPASVVFRTPRYTMTS
jgi:hypothetical protein